MEERCFTWGNERGNDRGNLPPEAGAKEETVAGAGRAPDARRQVGRVISWARQVFGSTIIERFGFGWSWPVSLASGACPCSRITRSGGPHFIGRLPQELFPEGAVPPLVSSPKLRPAGR